MEMKTVSLLIICYFLFFLLMGCRKYDAKKNENYIKGTLGKIILDFKSKHNRLPETFSEAHNYTGTILQHRGDYYSNPIIYFKTGDNSFYFLSYGRNGKNEGGAGDDLKVEYLNGVWK